MNLETYLDQPGISASAIKRGAMSMRHMRHAMTVRTEATDAMQLGSLTHLAILEPGKLATAVAVWTGGRRYGKAWNQFQADNADKLIVRPDDVDSANAIGGAVRCNADAARLLAGCEYEQSIAWEQEPYGRAKARIDAYKRGVIIDVKTCRQIDRLDRACVSAGWHLQLGWYNRGRQLATEQSSDLFVIVAESAAPFDVAVVQIGYDLAEYGEEKAVKIATRYRECEAAGTFPGVASEPLVVGLPEWMMDDAEMTGFENTEEQI